MLHIVVAIMSAGTLTERRNEMLKIFSSFSALERPLEVPRMTTLRSRYIIPQYMKEIIVCPGMV